MFRTIVGHRVTRTFLAIALIVLGWNAYIARHDDGILTGYVIGQDGQPVAGARVTISALSQISRNVIASTTTQADGQFSFVAHGAYAMYIEAEQAGAGLSRRREVRLYFRNQNRALDEPLVLDPAVKRGVSLAPLDPEPPRPSS